MRKKGSWFSALIRVFTPHSKEKAVNGSEKKKRWGFGRLMHGETRSFIPLFREPSSIEKILGEAEREQQRAHSLESTCRTREKQHPHSLQPREQKQTLPLPQQTKERCQFTPTPNDQHSATIKIQTAYRAYAARKSFRALKGLVRLQGVIRGQSVKRQTVNAMRCLQLQVRVQQQIHSRRIQMMENQSLQHQLLHKGDKEIESSISKGTITQPSEADQQEEWDDSILTKEEIDARMQRKVEAVVKRERALTYAYSHQQLWKDTPKLAHDALMQMRSGRFPWWWSWLERKNPPNVQRSPISVIKNDTRPLKLKVEHHNDNEKHMQPQFSFDNKEIVTPRSVESFTTPKAVKNTGTSMSAMPQIDSLTPSRNINTKASGDESSIGATPTDNESLTSCPPFSIPNYMTPTVSAKAKVRAHSTQRSTVTTPRHDSMKRLSFPLTQSVGFSRWNNGSLFSAKDYTSQRILSNTKSLHSAGDLSVNSTLSLPAAVGRKPFK